MSDWKSVLKEDPTEWLLEKNNPSVRYFTLTEVLDKPVSGREAKEAKNQIVRVGVVPSILAKQNNEGFWEAHGKNRKLKSVKWKRKKHKY